MHFRKATRKLFSFDENQSVVTERRTHKLLKKLTKLQKKLVHHSHKQSSNPKELEFNLLLLGPGGAGKSTLIKQMQLLHGDSVETSERRSKISCIRQNIFDSMIAILVAMRRLGIALANPTHQQASHRLLHNSQVNNPHLTCYEILHSDFLASRQMIDDVAALWTDAGVQKTYSRSNEYQLLDCAAYFFERLSDIRDADYTPSDQDILRCRAMTTSITETKLSACYSKRKVNFKVVDVGGQQGERRKWITLFDNISAVLFMIDATGFDRTLIEDSKTNRLLESLKLFHQSVTSRYLSHVSIVAFLNKIDLLKEKIEGGADFEASIEQIREQALEMSLDNAVNDNDQEIYRHLHEILTDNRYEDFTPSESQTNVINDAFPATEPSHKSQSLTRQLSNLFRHRSNSTAPSIDERVTKAAAYLKMILMKIVSTLKQSQQFTASRFCATLPAASRSYDYQLTCAVNTENSQRVINKFEQFMVHDYYRRLQTYISKSK